MATRGVDHADTVLTHGLLGVALARVGRQDDALATFRAAVPRIIAIPVEDVSANQLRLIRVIVAGYGRLLDERRATRHADGTPDGAEEMFLLAHQIHVR